MCQRMQTFTVPPPAQGERWGSRLEPVARAAHREDVSRVVGALLEDLPEAHDEVVHGPRLERALQAPDLLEEAPPRDHLVRVLREDPHDRGLLRRELAVLAGRARGTERLEVHLAVAEGERLGPLDRPGVARGRLLGARGAHPDLAPQESLDASEQLLEIERLREIVVGPGLDARDHVLRVVARREHEDRRPVALTAPVARDLHAVGAGEHDVEDDEVEALLAEELEGLVALVEDLDLEALVLEVEPEALRYVLLVLDEQDLAHAAAPGASGTRTRNDAPRPGPSLSATTVPAWPSTIERTMNRPRPVPLRLRWTSPSIR